ncbi:DUF4062 domain-containing protein [Planktotalea sp.]|uniref:DUF4062 domain-containing protein n=1 Tax=Planktotalea sp. TaxID=2029877 RepID=UPI00329960C4
MLPQIGKRASGLEKRYQVFISSTFQDLQTERQRVSEVLLRAGCFPVGMEQFPAADEEQFEFIKRVIDQSDYYILISAGRYGSIHPETGLSYTEMEYDYAVERGKPIIRLLHKDPFKTLIGESIEPTDEGRAKLLAFQRKLQEKRLVAFWGSSSELQLEATLALGEIQRNKPALGWIRPNTQQIESNELQSNSLDTQTLAREIGYQNLRSQIVPNRMRLSHNSIKSTSMFGSALSKFDCDLCNGDTFITIRNANAQREMPCPKCEDEGRV